MVSSTVLDELRQLGPVFRSSEAVAAGVSWRDLYALRDAGELIEFSRGVFQLADVGFDRVGYVAVCARVPDGMICMDSALEYWDLTDQIPPRVHVAVASGASAGHRLPAYGCARVQGRDVQPRAHRRRW